MTEQTKRALEQMQAANAALTPEQRKARSEKAAATRKARLAGAAQAGNGGSERSTATVAARVKPEAAPVVRTWRVAVRVGEGAVAWICVDAPGMQRAGKLARKAHKGATVLGVVREGVLPGTITGA